jgi:hypothetical protein
VNPSSTTTTTTSDLSSTTTTSVTPGAEVGPGPGSTTGDTTAAPPGSDPSQHITVTEDPGACQWRPDTGELVDSGMFHNSGTEDVVAEVEVTWSDTTGELDSYSDLQTVPAGGSQPWSVSDNLVDTPPQGLTCQIALI